MEKKKRRKDKEKSDRTVLVEQPSPSSLPRSKTIKEKDEPGPKTSSTKGSEKVPKSESREARKHYPVSPEVRTVPRGGVEDLARELKKEKSKHEHRSSDRREAREERNRDRDKGRSSDACSSWHNGHSDGRSHRSRSRSRDRSHRQKKSHSSRERDSSNLSERRRH